MTTPTAVNRKQDIKCYIELLVITICTLILTYICIYISTFNVTYLLCYMCKLLLVGLVIAAKRPKMDPWNLLSLFKMFYSQDRRLLLSCVICIFFNLILDSPVGLWAEISLAGEWVPEMPSFESWSQQRKTTWPLSIPKWLACARVSKLTTKTYTQGGLFGYRE